MTASLKSISFVGLWGIVVLLNPIAWVHANSVLMSRDDAYELLVSNQHDRVTSLPLGEREILLATLALDADKVDDAIDFLDSDKLAEHGLAALLRAEAYRRKSVAAAVRSGDYAHAASAGIHKLKGIRLNTGLDEAEKRLTAFMTMNQIVVQAVAPIQSLPENPNNDAAKVVEVARDKELEKSVVDADLNSKLTQDITDSVGLMLETWRKDWQSRDMQAYLSHYDAAFKTPTQDYASWASYKTRINAKKSYIHVILSNIQIQMMDDGRAEAAAKVTFTQDYKSSNYSARSRKKLYLRRYDANTDWKILFEGNP